MSRITDSIKALKAERRAMAAKLKRFDRLIESANSLNEPRAPRTAAVRTKPKPTGKARKSSPRARNNVILASKTASLTAAASAD